jgi:hypothetical protein
VAGREQWLHPPRHLCAYFGAYAAHIMPK